MKKKIELLTDNLIDVEYLFSVFKEEDEVQMESVFDYEHSNEIIQVPRKNFLVFIEKKLAREDYTTEFAEGLVRKLVLARATLYRIKDGVDYTNFLSEFSNLKEKVISSWIAAEFKPSYVEFENLKNDFSLSSGKIIIKNFEFFRYVLVNLVEKESSEEGKIVSKIIKPFSEIIIPNYRYRESYLKLEDKEKQDFTYLFESFKKRERFLSEERDLSLIFDSFFYSDYEKGSLENKIDFNKSLVLNFPSSNFSKIIYFLFFATLASIMSYFFYTIITKNPLEDEDEEEEL